MKRNKLVTTLIAGAVAIGLLAGAAATYAQADIPTGVPALAHRGDIGRMGGSMSDGGQALADALGITLEDLAAAQLAARNAMIDQAVVDGHLTQEQADALKAGTSSRGIRFGGLYDSDEYLAEALGITVDELDAAELEAYTAQLAAAVAAGTLTQEQADLLQARKAAKTYLDTDGLQAQVQAAYEAALAAAVADGAITQAQADALLAQMAAQPWGFGFGGFGGRGGHHGGPRGFGGFGGFGGSDNTTPAPSTTPESETSTGQGA